MIRHHDVGVLSLAARTVYEACCTEIGALPSQTIMACRGDRASWQRPIVNLEAVHIVVPGLLNIGEQRGERWCLGLLLTCNKPHARTVGHDAADAPQAWVM